MAHGAGAHEPLSLDSTSALDIVAAAVRAPSIHNTQPWRWRLDGGDLLVLADRSRQLTVADPDGHSMLISCGAALTLTELALQEQGWRVETVRWPDPSDADVLARIHLAGREEPTDDVRAAFGAALSRHSDRRPFAAEVVSSETIEQLRDASAAGSARVDFPLQEDQRINLAVAVSWADGVGRNDDAYIAEMNKWLRDPEVNAADGIPAGAVPHVAPGHPRRTDVPVRDFELGVTGRQMIELDVDERPLIAVVLTDSDSAADHLLAGESMMRLMIKAEQLGLSTCALSQAVDLAGFRTRVQGLMGWIGYPQMMLRIGYPSGPAEELAFTPRRDPADVLDVSPAA